MKQTLRILPILALVSLILAGCASPKPTAMIPADFKPESKRPNSIRVTTPTPGMKWTTQLKSDLFVQALALSIQKSGAFATVVETPDADYLLEVSLVQAKEPAFGFNMTVDLATRWVLTRRSSKEEVFKGTVSTTYTANVGEAFAGGTRLRKANEGAVRENIKEGLRRLAKANL